MLSNLHHVGLSVTDLEQSIAFYRDVIGLQLVAPLESFAGERYSRLLALRDVRGRVALLTRGSLKVELFQFEHPAPHPKHSHYPVSDHGLSHFCIQVQDIETEYTHLKRAGVHLHCEPLYFEGEGYATYARDPDGNIFELFEARATP